MSVNEARLHKPFVLERVENPHPIMLEKARKYRLAAVTDRRDPLAYHRWSIYLEAMCDATGETAEAIEAWMDRQP